ncbi:AMP-binding protein [Epidermidibacterium keratini]|uniref:AMP-binding protein n=1 Tax=Epidermidibacterium keratini TaxID=1891644 RepID=A0A7L4YM21_9ACTN|nr:AMP-binding protein [Epidermidibacterium keratini]QHB99922.1 AMP-binding protein [Epidermidibacterium keratini]
MSGLSYASGVTMTPLLGETIGEKLERTAEQFGEREALVESESGRRWTWSQLNEVVDQVATGLLDLGIEKGDRVGIWAPNCAEWVLTQYATAKIGAILVNINPAYRTHELAYVLNQSEISTLVSAVSFKTSDYKSMVGDVRSEAMGLKQVIFIGEQSWNDLEATKADPERVSAAMASLDRDDPINIQYTSGTTGFPKGATLSHHNILNNGFFMTEAQGWTEEDIVCVPVPFYHCFGMVMGNLGALTHGTCVVIPAPGFDPVLTLNAVEGEKCTALYGVPTMFIAMLNELDKKPRDLSSLRTGVMAGSPCPVEVMKRVISEMNMEGVTICYGMTETSPVSAQTLPDDDLQRRTETVGRVHPHQEIKIIDPATGLTLPYGETGEYCTRGYSVMLGYWNNEEKTAEAIDSGGWMHTGDLATMDEHGYVNIVGRLKDMVIRGGENLYPREIEEFLYTHPDIDDVQVVGVPDEKYGEELVAWIKMRGDAEPLDADKVREFSNGKLAHYKIPKYVIIADEFPMTVTGKVRKVDMRQTSIEQLGLEKAASAKHA